MNRVLIALKKLAIAVPFLRRRKMSHCKFDAELKWSCLMETVKIVRAGNLNMTNVSQAIQHVSCFLGSACEVLKDDQPPVPDSPDGPEVDVSFGDLPVEGRLNTLCNDLEKNCPCDASGNTTYAAIPWTIILPIILPIAQKLLRELLEKLLEKDE